MKKKTLLILVAALAIIIFWTKEEGAKAREIQQGIAGEIIRFHVIANSDTEEDQALKLEVKEEILEYMQEFIGPAKNVDETRKLLTENQENIRILAEKIVREKGYEYKVQVFFDNRYFPVKTYGNYTFPPGIYEAFCVEIGESQGKNWWCVMYPSLCFVDVVHGVVPEETDRELKNILTEEEYEEIAQGQEKVQVKFKILEWLEELVN